MNSFMSWVGGKKALREEVVRRFPLYYERYIEVFGGGGWVLFHKNPGNDFEVYNDFNGLLTNLYRCVREKPDLLMGSLRLYVLYNNYIYNVYKDGKYRLEGGHRNDMNIKYRLLCKRLIEERKRVGVIQYYNVLFIMELLSDKDIWSLEQW